MGKAVKKSHIRIYIIASVILAVSIVGVNRSFAGHTNEGGVANTLHNLSLPWVSGTWADAMNLERNNYDRVCVYCHTPHGANSQLIEAPLWNRTHLGNTYTVYTDEDSGTELGSGQEATQPGVSSLTCLSCHDGTVAVDSIVNMPGSGLYDPAQETAQSETFLDSWNTEEDPVHMTITTCTSTCHSGAMEGLGAPDFRVVVLGIDLTNDHPIGVHIPDATEHGFNKPTAVDGNKWFYDEDGDLHADRNEIRLYNTTCSAGNCPEDSYEVECASCHDPHGVKFEGGGDKLADTFLRLDNVGSKVCLTCHIK